MAIAGANKRQLKRKLIWRIWRSRSSQYVTGGGAKISSALAEISITKMALWHSISYGVMAALSIWRRWRRNIISQWHVENGHGGNSLAAISAYQQKLISGISENGVSASSAPGGIIRGNKHRAAQSACARFAGKRAALSSAAK